MSLQPFSFQASFLNRICIGDRAIRANPVSYYDEAEKTDTPTMTDHDRLFKELLTTFFVEFLELFLPEVARAIEPDSVVFLPQEYFADLTTGETKIIDLLAQVRLAGQEVGFLIHVEAQATSKAEFSRRMFFYFARLHQKYLQRIYPIVIFSFDEPYREEPNQYLVEFENLKVMEFNFFSIQLNRLNWIDFLNQPNPVAAALMSKMKIDPSDRPRVKVECLRLLATLRLTPAKSRLISGFVDTYLRLNVQEEQAFQTVVGTLEESEQEGIMQIVTSWMEQGIAQGEQRGEERGVLKGRTEGEQSLILRLLKRRIGELSPVMVQQIQSLSLVQLESLGEALLDFTRADDLVTWMQRNS
jgi:predicted transposase/invertase (TIGR01784 family)